MVTLGTDSHKQSHTLVAVDENGRHLGELRVAATPAGHREGLSWARQWRERRWAMENCRQLSRGLERDLLVAGEQVLQVSPKLMGTSRRSGRQLGKSDPIDAMAVARVALREPNLPVGRPEGKRRELKLLVDHREDLVGARTRIQNRLLWHLHELEPGLQIAPGGLTRRVVLKEVTRRLEAHQGVVSEIARELVKLLAETADALRYHSRGAFAMQNGTAPIPVWSGNQQRHRLNRGGNRQLNVALHRIAITQIRLGGDASAYVLRRLSLGNSKTEAIRSLRRQLSDEVYRRLRLDRLEQF